MAGEPIERGLVEPVSPSASRDDPLAETMIRLGVAKGSPGRTIQLSGRRYEFTGEEYEAFKAFTQQARWRMLTPVVNSPQFQQAARVNPDAARDYLERGYDEIGRKARDAWLIQHPEVVGKVFAQPQAPVDDGSRFLR